MSNKQKLADYCEPNFHQKDVELTFSLFDDYCLVRCKSKLVRRRKGQTSLRLLGKELELISLELDGENLVGSPRLALDGDSSIELTGLTDEHELNVLTKIFPHKNKSLEGLYKTSNFYCSQNEPDGFRRITYFLDRPDNMANYICHIEADKTQYPVLLSNGNLTAREDLVNNRHRCTWLDPFAKPSYLFALVAGDLEKIESSYTTGSGREIKLEIFSEAKYLDRLDFAMQALKDSMKWDEERFGLEYDLDIYMIVVSDDFNAGAMENKGLNIFNSKYLLASPETSSELDYYLIQSVVAHEYFHNYSGNRVTCRDWFQLSLKEGLTVFRDQEFTSDLNSRAVKRIEDVVNLRSQQFPEDAGPNSHPVRPHEVQSIANFYSATVYEKGAELIRMVHTIIGENEFRKASDLYFERFDGMAVTCDDFIDVMAESSGIDFAQFRKWYSQSGTPEVHFDQSYNSEAKTLRLNFSQRTNATNDQTQKEALLIPCRMSFLSPEGAPLTPKAIGGLSPCPSGLANEYLYLINSHSNSIELEFEKEPVTSLFRGFSAPIVLKKPSDRRVSSELLASIETDSFNRFEALSELKKILFYEVYGKGKANSSFTEAFTNLLCDQGLDDSFINLCLKPLDKNYLILDRTDWDIEKFDTASKEVSGQIAGYLKPFLEERINLLADEVANHTGLHLKGKKELLETLLFYGAIAEPEFFLTKADALYKNSSDFSSQKTALQTLKLCSSFEPSQPTFSHFKNKWKDDKLVINNYLKIVCSRELGVEEAWLTSLMKEEFFDPTNPNNLYSSLASFASNFIVFHKNSSWSYQYFWDQVKRVDAFNPQVAGRLAGCMIHWEKFGPSKKQKMRQILHDLSTQEVSENLAEILANNLKTAN